MDGAALLEGKVEGIGIAQPGKEKLWGHLTVALQCLKELTGKVERDCFQGRGETGPEQCWAHRCQGSACASLLLVSVSDVPILLELVSPWVTIHPCLD